ncbi:MAG: hypothetical protein ACR2L2_12450, partial [Acidobacteriota bacterium]
MQTKYALLFLVLFLGTLTFGLAQDIVPLTDSFSTFVGGSTISNDGSTVFYTRSSRNHWALYARRSGSTQPETLAKGEGQTPGLLSLNAANSWLILATSSQIFSFDLISRKLALLTNRYRAPDFVDRVILDERGKVVFGTDDGIFSVPFGGGPTERLSPVDSLAFDLDPRGELLYFVPRLNQTAIISLNTRTGEQQQLIEPNRIDSRIQQIFVSADSLSILVAGDRSNYRLSISSGTLQRVFDDALILHASGDRRWLLLFARSSEMGAANRVLFLGTFEGVLHRQLASKAADLRIGRSWALSRDAMVLAAISPTRLPGKQTDPPPQNSQSWLYRVDTLLQNFELVDHTALHRQRFPTGLADNEHVVFLSSLGAATDGFEFIRARRDGTHFQQLGKLGVAIDSWQPGATASANGRVVAWVQRAPSAGKRHIMVHRTEGRRLFEVAEVPFAHDGFSEPPVFGGFGLDALGTRLVFASALRLRDIDPVGQVGYIYLADISDSGVQLKLLATRGWNPSISADGKLVAFESTDFPLPFIHVLRADGSGQLALGRGSRPRLNADGQWVAYLSHGQYTSSTGVREYRGITLARTDGSRQRPIAPAGTQFGSVAINADGRVAVAFGVESAPGEAKPGYFLAAFDDQDHEMVRLPVPSPIDHRSLTVDAEGAHAYFSRIPTEVLGSFLSEQIYVARLRPFNYFAAGLHSRDASFAGIAFSNPHDSPVEVSLTARTPGGAFLVTANSPNPVTKVLKPNEQTAGLLSDFFDSGVSRHDFTVMITSPKRVHSMFIVGGSDHMYGAAASDRASRQWIFPLNDGGFESSSLVLVNPGAEPATAEVRINYPGFVRLKTVSVPPLGTASLDPLRELLFPSAAPQYLLEVSSRMPLLAELRLFGKSSGRMSSVSSPTLKSNMASDFLILPHALTGGGYS